jgi:hypothetical protein
VCPARLPPRIQILGYLPQVSKIIAVVVASARAACGNGPVGSIAATCLTPTCGLVAIIYVDLVQLPVWHATRWCLSRDRQAETSAGALPAAPAVMREAALAALREPALRFLSRFRHHTSALEFNQPARDTATQIESFNRARYRATYYAASSRRMFLAEPKFGRISYLR